MRRGVIHALAILVLVHSLRQGGKSVVVPVAHMGLALAAALALFLLFPTDGREPPGVTRGTWVPKQCRADMVGHWTLPVPSEEV